MLFKERSLRAALAAVSLLAVLALAAACGEGEEGEPTPTARPAPTPAASPVAVPDIRDVDFATVDAVRRLIDSLGGGEVLPEEVIYADLTGDGAEEAVVPIFSGGSGGNVAYAVFGREDGQLKELLFVRPETGRVSVAVDEGTLKETQPIYGPDDPLCCPGRLQNRYYGWDGQKLAVDREETIDNPTAKP